MDRERIIETLKERVRVARAHRDLTSSAFDQVLKSVPSGIPHPDGTERVRQASQKWAHAQNALTEAVWELNEFTMRGVVPRDLENS
jgi:hypothetical protein